MKRQALQVFDHLPAPLDLREEVLKGLAQRQKTLPAKLFYDERGSRLFEAITALPEYYLTRTEIGLLRQHGGEIARIVGAGSVLLEYGAGASLKIRLLLEALRPDCYVPMDISREFLLAAAQRLLDDYDWLSIYAACVDYSQPLSLPRQIEQAERKLGFFPGSSLGNFTPPEAQQFLQRVRQTLGRGSYFLLGVDLEKNAAVLEAAYNDQQGVTAAFNKNMLRHLNQTLGAGFDEQRFRHEARYNSEQSRIEMHLISEVDQVLNVGGRQIALRKGESIHTENSCKYHPDRLQQMAQTAGFDTRRIWTDERGYFALLLLQGV